ncbi:hypothetical protein OVA29_05495 [Exiguobacterium sp. SL14]|nr:hypothetical protein [Exiguobacterium sp. SL14]MCY1690296.1 hypothetical protein [Exiguobacterium sp. SL14]
MRQERHFFVALPIPSEELAKLAGRLSLSDYFRNVYTQEEYHLTLRFFGPLQRRRTTVVGTTVAENRADRRTIRTSI